LDNATLESCCSNFEHALKHNEKSDIDFKNHIILLTIPVTVAFAERSFSKLKLLKSYMRSTILQERHNGLAMIAIENAMMGNIQYEELIDQVALVNVSRKTRFGEKEDSFSCLEGW